MKAAELRELTDEEIKVKLEEMRKDNLNIRFQMTTQQAENPARVRFLKRDIARLLTIVNERKNAKDGSRS
ncbi:MAG: hypothetical protein IEMM0002_0041 [bacterium]|nr:MAG: hypothetical protein IEMM0002_0041 [bacterium]